MASRSVLLGSSTLKIKGDHAYISGVKAGDRLFSTIEPNNKHSDNAIAVKSGNDDIFGHVPETLAKKLFNFMKNQQIQIMDSEVTGDPRPAPEGKWVIGCGTEIPCKYTRIFFYKKPSKGPSSISFLFQVQILVLKVS